MPFDIQFVIQAIAAPAAVALIVAGVLQRVLPAQIGQRTALALAVAAGFCAGYWLLGEWTTLVPQRHRQWLPWLAITAALLGWARALSTKWWPALTLLTIASAYLLVPTWDSLRPPRELAMPLLAVYLLAIIAFLAALPDRLVGRLFIGMLAASAFAVAMLIAIGVSLKIGQVAVASAAVLSGCWMAAFVPRAATKSDESGRATASRGLIPVYVVLIGGLAFIGTIEPQRPLPIILLAPAAPLMLWLFAAGPLAQLHGWKSAVLQLAAVFLPLIGAIAVVAL